MEVVCLESEALYKLVKEVVLKLKPDFENHKSTWVDGQEAMAILNCGKTKLQELRNSGEIEFTQPSRKAILYKRESLLEYLNKHKRTTF